MTQAAQMPAFLAGVIEGFYGKPWSPAERLELLDWMAAWGLNTYLYAPKDDLKHRVLWREPYAAEEATQLGELVRACRSRHIRFIHAVSPGLDIRYGRTAELDALRAKFEQVRALGIEDFALLFDDIPDQMDTEDRRRFGSFAAAQSHVANVLFRWARQAAPQGRFLFCPTAYCGRMAAREIGGKDYLPTLGRELSPGIDVLWTGPEIISREITAAHAGQIAEVLRRPPLIWDNLHANDYDSRRFFCGPYAGREPALREAVAGLLSNPNCELPLNYVPLRTLAAFVHCAGEWDARAAWLSALREWLPRFTVLGRPAEFEDLVLLGDAFYLPHQEGPEAEALAAGAQWLLTRRPEDWGGEAVGFLNRAARLRGFCTRLAALEDRPLFHALSRRLWELREELDLLEQYVRFKQQPGNADAPFHSDFHLPGTYRGGLVARLQRLLVQQPDGTFRPAGPPGACDKNEDTSGARPPANPMSTQPSDP